MSSQNAFAAALLAPELACPSGLTCWNGSDPAARFAVYRNNVLVSWIDALAESYPVVQALVGEEFFRAMARVFALAHPPQSPIMAFYGGEFAGFLASFSPVASLPYLADVARLEMARVLAYHAADVNPIEPQAWQAALSDAEQLPELRLGLHPSVFVLDSAFAVLSIWAAHQGSACMSPVDADVAQAALVYRRGLDVEMLEIPSAAARFVRALQSGQSLLDAAEAAHSDAAEFDVTQTMATLLRLNLLTHLSNGDPHEQKH